MNAEFARIQRLPPYVFNVIDELKAAARGRGMDVIDFGMGNPDQPTPQPILDVLLSAAQQDNADRYSSSRGILRLREAVCDWYQRKFSVTLDADTETVATIGSKEGLAHLALAITGAGDSVLVPDPAYPIHLYGFIIAGAQVIQLPLLDQQKFFTSLVQTIKETWPKPKALVLNFPSNPTTQCVDLDFFAKVIDIAREHEIWVIHDLAYADICFDGYQAPSILQVPGAKDVAVESYSLSKSYNMPGWRVGIMSGNPELIAALTRIKSYLDYGIYLPIQLAAATALEHSEQFVPGISQVYQDRRDFLCAGLNAIAWAVTPPKATMFVWAKIPEAYQEMGSLKFCEYLIENASVAVSPGIAFGEQGEGYVRFSLIEENDRMQLALDNLQAMFERDAVRSSTKPSVTSAKVGVQTKH